MNKTHNIRVLSFLLCAVLIAAMALGMMGCNEQPKTNGGDTTPTTTAVTNDGETTSTTTAMTNDGETTPTTTATTNDNELGQGAVTFTFTVTDKEGNSTEFIIHTDKAVVGEALMEHGLVQGEEGAYGLYVKTVNGITADYDVDKTYWAFYVNGEYAMTGVDKTAVTEGASYAFKVEK